MKYERESISRIAASGLLVALALIAPTVATADSHAAPETIDGLVLVPDSRVQAAYVDPDADFTVYNKVMMLDCFVAFKKDWQKNTQTTGSRHSVSASQMERIKNEVAIMFREVFAQELSQDGGYEIVDEAGEDVLLIRPAIVDLDIAAPDVNTPARSRTYTSTSGSATLFIELYDSSTSDLLARAADRRTARRSGGYLTYTNRVTNTADARRMFRSWAKELRAALDEIHGK